MLRTGLEGNAWLPCAARSGDVASVCFLLLRTHHLAERHRWRRRNLAGAGGSELLHKALLLFQQLLGKREAPFDHFLHGR